MNAPGRFPEEAGNYAGPPNINDQLSEDKMAHPYLTPRPWSEADIVRLIRSTVADDAALAAQATERDEPSVTITNEAPRTERILRTLSGADVRMVATPEGVKVTRIPVSPTRAEAAEALRAIALPLTPSFPGIAETLTSMAEGLEATA